VNDHADMILPCEIGWLDAREFVGPEVLLHGKASLVHLNWGLRIYGRLIGGRECGQLHSMGSDLSKLMLAADDGHDNPFPD
jgi:hypothetical protein